MVAQVRLEYLNNVKGNVKEPENDDVLEERKEYEELQGRLTGSMSLESSGFVKVDQSDLGYL